MSDEKLGTLFFGGIEYTLQDQDLIVLLGEIAKMQRSGKAGVVFGHHLGGDYAFLVNPAVAVSAIFNRPLSRGEVQVARGFFRQDDDGFTVPVFEGE